MGKFNKEISTDLGESLETLQKGTGRGNTRGTKKSILLVIEPELREFVDRRVYDLSSPGHMMTLNGYLKMLIEEDKKKHERKQAKNTEK